MLTLIYDVVGFLFDFNYGKNRKEGFLKTTTLIDVKPDDKTFIVAIAYFNPCSK